MKFRSRKYCERYFLLNVLSNIIYEAIKQARRWRKSKRKRTDVLAENDDAFPETERSRVDALVRYARKSPRFSEPNQIKSRLSD